MPDLSVDTLLMESHPLCVDGVFARASGSALRRAGFGGGVSTSKGDRSAQYARVKSARYKKHLWRQAWFPKKYPSHRIWVKTAPPHASNSESVHAGCAPEVGSPRARRGRPPQSIAVASAEAKPSEVRFSRNERSRANSEGSIQGLGLYF